MRRIAAIFCASLLVASVRPASAAPLKAVEWIAPRIHDSAAPLFPSALSGAFATSPRGELIPNLGAALPGQELEGALVPAGTPAIALGSANDAVRGPDALALPQASERSATAEIVSAGEAAQAIVRHEDRGIQTLSRTFDGGNYHPGKPLSILMIASEAVPFVKTGGLADVVGSLSSTLGQMGHRVVVALPRFEGLALKGYKVNRIPGLVTVPLDDRKEDARILHTRHGPVDVLFVDHPFFSRQKDLYGMPNDNERFILFVRAALEAAKLTNFQPDIVHAHDWQAALAPALLKTLYVDDAFFRLTGSLLSIHNIAFQGNFPANTILKMGLGWSYFNHHQFEFHGAVGFLKAGILYADLVRTVSETYAQETLGVEGKGLEGVLQFRQKDYGGIVNGIDVDEWNPETDPRLVKNYSLENNALESKETNKKAFRQKYGLTQDTAPLLGVVTRISGQKGLHFVAAVLPRLLRSGMQFALLGDAAPTDAIGARTAARFRQLAKDNPNRFFFYEGFNNDLAHWIYAISDFFGMPSLFEPCGLGQQIAMRYGALPIGPRVGGLADTIVDPREGGIERGTGFFMDELSAKGLMNAMTRALGFYNNAPGVLGQLVANAMRRDASWSAAVGQYVGVYRQAKAQALRRAR